MTDEKKTSSKKKAKKKVAKKKPTKPQDMESTKGVTVTPSVRQVVSGRDALVKISIFVPEYEPVAYEIVIPDLTLCLPLNARSPEHVIPHIVTALKKKFGLRVKRK